MRHSSLRVCVIFISIFFLSSPSAFSKSYERIISLAPSITEILFAIGAGDRVVGVTTHCDYPEEAKLKPKVGGFLEQNIEAIVAQKPDLVMIAPNRGTKFTNEKLKQLGIETLIVPFYSLDDLVKSFELIGEKVGNWDRAKVLQAEVIQAINEVRARSVNRLRRKAVFITWQTPLIIPAGGTLEGDVMELSGGDNIAKDSPLHYPKFSIEAIFERDPDLIIDASSHGRQMSLEERKEMVRKFWSQYSSLRAVRSGEVYVFKTDVYSVPSPRTVRFIKAMGALFDPETKPENEFYERVKF